MIQGAEGIVKTLLLWNTSAFILLLGLTGRGKKKTQALAAAFLFLGVVYITLVKTQWWIGPFLASFLLLVPHRTRKIGALLFFACLASFGIVRSINYFHYQKNTEFFSSSGLMSLRLARGQEIVAYGCTNNLFPPGATNYLCASAPRAYTWHEVIRNIEPMSEVISLAEVTAKIDKIVLLKNWPSSLKRFWEQSSTAFQYLISPRQETPSRRKIILSFLIFPLFFYWLINNFYLKGLALLSVWTMTLLPFFASTMVAPWIDRYAGPICLYFYLVPIMGAADLLFSKAKRLYGAFSADKFGNQP